MMASRTLVYFYLGAFSSRLPVGQQMAGLKIIILTFRKPLAGRTFLKNSKTYLLISASNKQLIPFE